MSTHPHLQVKNPSWEKNLSPDLVHQLAMRGIWVISLISLNRYEKKSNKTQSETARYLGITLRTYQNYEGGKSEPSIPQFINMANFFMVSLDELVGRDWSEY